MVTSLELVLSALRKVVGVPVVALVPAKRPSVFVRVEQSAPAGYSPSHDRSMFIVQVYGTHALTEEVIELIGKCRDFLRFGLPIDNPSLVGWEEISGPVEFPDPDLVETHTRWQLAGYAFHTLT